MDQGNMELPAGKENFSRDEVQALLEKEQNKFITQMDALKSEISILKNRMNTGQPNMKNPWY